MATVLIRNLSDNAKARLETRASLKARSLEAELRDILEKEALLEAGNPDDLEPMGSWLVRITRPGFDDVADAIAAARHAPERSMLTFDD